MRRLPRLALLLAALCALPAPARAEVTDFGSDLSSPANIAANHGADTSYWNAGLASGGLYEAPAEGQVTDVKLKGAVLPNPRLRNTTEEDLAQLIHFQVLRETGDGRLKVVALSTGHLKIPVSDSPEEVVTKYEPVNLCVRRGDLVAFNTIGAHEYRRDFNHQGAEYQVFGRVPGSRVQWYEKDNGLNEGTRILPSPTDAMVDQELLMRTTLATGPNATDICPGGYQQHVFRGLEHKPPTQPSLKTKTRVARLKGFCHGENYGGCFGTLKLEATLNGQPVLLGEARFSIKSAFTEVIEVPISPANVLAIQRERRVVATATAEARDNPSADTRVKWDTIPVQSVTTSDKVTLTPDKAACVVPNVVGKGLATAKKSLVKAGCRVGKITRRKNKSRAGRILAQVPAPGTALPGGTRIRLTLATK